MTFVLESYSSLFEEMTRHPAIFESQMIQDLKVHREDIEFDLSVQTNLYIKWAMLASLAEDKFNRLRRWADEEVWSWAKSEARNTNNGPKDKIEEIAYQNEKYIAAQEAKFDAQRVLDIFKKVESAMWQKKAMIEKMSFSKHREYAHPVASAPSHDPGEYPEQSPAKLMAPLEAWAKEQIPNPRFADVDDLESAARSKIRRNKETINAR